MPRQPFGIVQQQIERLLQRGSLAGLSEWQLLERYATERDELAFEALVARNGSMVLGVCRRVLHHDQAAEDAFQATFLVLMRKAPSLDGRKPLGNWLYTVAYRLALRIRANESQRLRREGQAGRSRPVTESHATISSDQAVVLEEELQRLPERHRAPLVLCYLEGKTNEQAAELLGCPRGSMSARLAQARDRLRAGLDRRGHVVPAAGIATLLAAARAEAEVPSRLLSDTVRTVLWFSSEQAGIAGVVSTRAVALAKGAFRAAFVFKLKIAAAVLVAVAMLGTGATMLLKAASQASPPIPAAEPLSDARPDQTADPDERLPSGALARMGSTHLRHGDVVSFAAYMPDGRELVTAGRDKTVRMWDLATGKELRRFDWSEAQPDSEPGVHQDGTMQQYEHQALEDRALNGLAALSSDGRFVAASRGEVVCWWATASGKRLHHLQTGQKGLLQLIFSADAGSLLTLGTGGETVAVWDVATGQCVRRSEAKAGGGPVANDQNALVSPGWKYLAYLTRPADNLLIHLRDLATGKELTQIDAGLGFAQIVCFSADDKTLFWDHSPARGIVASEATTGKELHRLGYHRRPDGDGPYDAALAIAVSADGKSLAVCRMSHTIELWDLPSGNCTYPLGQPTEPQLVLRCTDASSAYVRPALGFSADGKTLICSLGGETAHQFQVNTGRELPGTDVGHRWPVSTLALSDDGKSLYTYGHGDPVRVWDWSSGKETGQRGAPDRATHAVFSREGAVGFATDGEFILSGPRGEKRWKIGEPPVSLALSPDGSLVAMRFWPNPEVRLRDAATGQVLYTLAQASDRMEFGSGTLTEVTGVVPAHLVFSPDGRYLAGAGSTRQLCLWDVTTGALLWQLPPQSGPAIERFAFSANSLCLATLNAHHTVTLHDAVSGAQRGRLGEAGSKKRTVHLTSGIYEFMQMRRDLTTCLAFSPDGRYLATAKDTPEIHLWDVLAGQELVQLEGHEGGVVSLLFSADGKRLFSGGSDTTALTWDLTRVTRPESARRESIDPAARLKPESLDALWTDLASNDATRAFDALRKLSTSSDQAITLIQEHVRPDASPDSKRVAQLLADLDNGRVEVRRKAEIELEGLGELAEPALRKALGGDLSLVLRQRVERLLDKLVMPTARQIRNLRAVELLEWMGSSNARQVLLSLADGVPGTRLTRVARGAVERLTNQVVTP